MRKMATLFLMSAFSTVVNASNFDSPEDAIWSLFEAYKTQDINKISQARDFDADAKFFLLKHSPSDVGANSLAEANVKAAMLFKNQLEHSVKYGLPYVNKSRCELREKELHDNGVVSFILRCKDNFAIVEDDKPIDEYFDIPVHAFKGTKGWRYIDYLYELP